MNKILLSVVLLIPGCAMHTQVYDSEGNAAHLIECNGAMNPLATCYREANDVCPSGYYLVGGDQTHMGNAAFASASEYGGGFGSMPVVAKHIMVKCK